MVPDLRRGLFAEGRRLFGLVRLRLRLNSFAAEGVNCFPAGAGFILSVVGGLGGRMPGNLLYSSRSPDFEET